MTRNSPRPGNRRAVDYLDANHKPVHRGKPGRVISVVKATTVSRWKLNKWERSAEEYRKRSWRMYRMYAPSFPIGLPSINDGHIGYDLDPCPRCLKLAERCDLYGAFERTINRCADANK